MLAFWYLPRVRWSCRRGAKCCDQYIFRMSAWITRKPYSYTLPILCMLLEAVARSSSCDGVAICYVGPTSSLWMTSCFHVMVLWHIMCRPIPKRWYNTRCITGKTPAKFCSTIKTVSTHCELCFAGEVCNFRLSCFVQDWSSHKAAWHQLLYKMHQFCYYRAKVFINLARLCCNVFTCTALMLK